MNSEDFINLVKKGAIEAQSHFGICASLTIAQAILESSYGKSDPGNNLFGIKWTNGCGYRSQTLPTREYYNGVWETINAQFRVYDSLADSVYDHALFLVNNSRYSNLLGVKDYKIACKLIQQDGYATDPNYTSQLTEIIEQYQLYQYDAIDSTLISATENPTLKAQIQALQYNLNLDYNAKLKNIDGNVYQETIDNLEAVGKLIVKEHRSHVVLWLQQKLESKGWEFLKPNSYTPMVYDEPTFQAITNLQKNWGRLTSGVLDINTWNIFLNN
ncbi:glucosaminidase domain-containing protein [Clostridium sp. DJ247]|uniref:glucosaminidase domain-containing protein n=1 Tax=Clostridium sp. DJ247 TaxID=2726188 RepID=UPI001629FF1A|nr:glucosaminidase domain-containing protein [Clostridium sp. DJ247]MBC2578835.1 glycoside hydrolase family 73 protein [Clostridium sp. DJ247]